MERIEPLRGVFQRVLPHILTSLLAQTADPRKAIHVMAVLPKARENMLPYSKETSCTSLAPIKYSGHHFGALGTTSNRLGCLPLGHRTGTFKLASHSKYKHHT